MTIEELKLRDAAWRFASLPEEGPDELDGVKLDSFLSGALSLAAKEYHIQGMYSEEQVKFITTRFAHECRLKGAVTNNDTIQLYDNWITNFLNK